MHLFFAHELPDHMVLLGKLNAAMTDTSLGTSKESKTLHISHSCGHTAVFSDSAGSRSAVLPCFAFIQFSFLLVPAVPSLTHRGG